MLQAVVDALNSQGANTSVQKLLQQLQDRLGGDPEVPEPVGPPRVYATDEGETPAGHLVALRWENLPGVATAFQVYTTAFDPDSDDLVPSIKSVQRGDALEDNGWAGGRRTNKSRIGYYASRIQAVAPDDIDEHGNVICFITLDIDEPVEFTGVGVYGYEEGKGNRYFLRDENVLYVPEQE